MASVSPLTSNESYPNTSPSLKRSGTRRKRQLVTSDDEDEGVQPVASSSKSTRRRLRVLDDDEDEEAHQAPSRHEDDIDIDVDDSSNHWHETEEVPPTLSRESPKPHKTLKRDRASSSAKSKGKGKHSGSKGAAHQDDIASPPSKKAKKSTNKRRNVDDMFNTSSEDDLPADMTESEASLALPTEDEFSQDDEGDWGQSKSKGKSKTVASGKAARGQTSKSGRVKQGRRGMSPLPKFRDEGRIAAEQRRPEDDMDVDIFNVSSTKDTAGPSQGSRLGSTSPSSRSVATSVGKDESTTTRAPVPAPRARKKLPVIKKIKASGAPPALSSGPATPVSATVKSVLDEVVPPSSASRLAAARTNNASDLDLMNKNIYDSLFKGGGNALGSDQRAKEEEEKKRKRQAMKEEYKAKRAATEREVPAFNLQAQFEKITRFEERLRANQSGALFPHYLAGKWKESWERNRNREKRDMNTGQTNGIVPTS